MAEELVRALKVIVDDQKKFMEKVLSEQKQFFSNQQQQVQISGTVPAFHHFDKTKDNWETYRAQLEQHFDAYGIINDSNRRAYFLSWSGQELYELLQKLFGNSDLKEKSYIELVKKLTEYFDEKTHVLAARCEFFRSKMKSNQSYAEWVADLRGIARQCKFVCSISTCKTEFVDELIRDIIVLHTPHDGVRTAALQKPNPSLADVLVIAEAYEATQKTIRTIETEALTNSSEVNELRMSAKKGGMRTRKEKTQYRKQMEEQADRHNKGTDKNFHTSKFPKSCSGCGVNHSQKYCKFRSAKCFKCNRTGHIAPVCIANSKKKRNNDEQVFSVNFGNQIFSLNSDCDDGKTLLKYQGSKYFIDMRVNGTLMTFQVDTGATCSVISLPAYEQLGFPPLKETSRELQAYGNISVPVLGVIDARVEYDNQEQILPLLITKTTEGGNIFGMNWFNVFNFKISSKSSRVNNLQSNTIADYLGIKVGDLCQKYKEIFEPSLGKCTKFQASLQLQPNAIPKFSKARILPFAQMDIFRAEVDRLVNTGIWKPIKFSHWAAPIVIASKRDGGIRICGDFKALNAQISIDQHPIPRVEELFYKLQGGKLFSKIDLSDAYFQVELDDNAKELLVVNTPLGLYQYQRLPFGVASAPAIFQKMIEQVIAGVSGCVNYLDDIIVTGRTMRIIYVI